MASLLVNAAVASTISKSAYTKDEPAEGEGSQGSEKEKLTGWKYLRSIAAGLLAAGSLAMQVVIILTVGGIPTFIAGGLGAFVAVCVGVRQAFLSKMDTLRDVHNKLRDEVNRMTEENNILSSNVNELSGEVDRVEVIEGELQIIAEVGQTNVNNLVNLIAENAETMRAQVKCVKAAVAEQILTSILRTDKDGDLQITDREVDILVMRLKHQEGVEIEEVSLRRELAKVSGSIGSLMEFFRHMEDETSENSPIAVNMEAYKANMQG